MHLSPPRPRPALILPIQYLRGLAALMVVWQHARGQVNGMSEFVGGSFGTSGVDLFFVISGFIMVFTTTGAVQSPWVFMRRRIVRVVPIYWLLTMLMVALAAAAPNLFKTLKVSPTTLLQSLFFVPHFSESFPTFVFPLLVPGWTLNYEVFFYALFAASMCLPARLRLVGLTLGLVALVAIGRVFGPFDGAAAQTYTSPLLLEFAGGALIAAWWVRHGSPLKLGASLVLIVVGSAMLVLRDTEPLGVGSQIVGALLVVIGALDPRFLAWRSDALRALGDSSYSLYLTHIFTLGAVRVVWIKLVPGAPTLVGTCAFMAISLAACAAVGWLTYRWVETPLVRGLGGRRRAAVSREVEGSQAPRETYVAR